MGTQWMWMGLMSDPPTLRRGRESIVRRRLKHARGEERVFCLFANEQKMLWPRRGADSVAF